MCWTKCPAGLQRSAWHFEPLSKIFPSWWLAYISGHSCIPCRACYNVLNPAAGQNVWHGLSSLPDISRSLPEMSSLSGIFPDHCRIELCILHLYFTPCRYYNWQIAGPIVMSVVLFQRPIPEINLDSLIKQHMPKKEVKRRGWIWWRTTDESTQAGEQKKVGVC